MKTRKQKLAYNLVVSLLLVVAIAWVWSKFIHFGNIEFTDNAQVKQQIVPINSRVQGFIKKIYYQDFQPVKKGDTLVVINDVEFRYRLAQAEAEYQNALTGKRAMGTTIQTTNSNIGISESAIAESKIQLDNSEREYMRYKNLLTQRSVTQQQYDGVYTAYQAAKVRYTQMKQQRNSTSLVKSEQQLRLNQNSATIELAKAAVELAKLNLSYTVILAPYDGVAGRKNIEEGQMIQQGQTLLDYVNESSKWVMANFKETQLVNIHEGQLVKIEVDAVPGVVFFGCVQAISRATGASFSLFSQDNSAGNFVKVEQRVPIRIEFTPKNKKIDLAKLRSGMNVECEVIY